MARKRFSDLERVYDALKLAKVDIKTLPANLDIRKYADWKEGEGPVRTIVRPSLGNSVIVGIKAFGLDIADSDNGFLVETNQRALTELNAGIAILGIEKTTLTGYIKNSSFVPAKITFTKKGASAPETSKITGRKYKKNVGNGYTLPFGGSTGKAYFQKVLDAVKGNTTFDTYRWSAQPEQWRRD